MLIASTVTLHSLPASNVVQDTLLLMENVNLALLIVLNVISWGMELVIKANAGVATQELAIQLAHYVHLDAILVIQWILVLASLAQLALSKFKEDSAKFALFLALLAKALLFAVSVDRVSDF
jgi:hypothetical protein